jgi:TonB-dependent receptor
MRCKSIARAGVSAQSALTLRLLSSLATLTAVAILAVPAAHAQAVAKGTIQGRVMNASNGQYLPGAVVTVEGTNLVAVTDNTGGYRIIDVPAGDQSIKAEFAGQTAVTTKVSVPTDAPVTVDLTFNGASVKRDASGTILLDPYSVAAERYKNAQEIAIQQERTSINIKNVVAADSFGDIPSGNVGEFVKFMPGVQVDYGSYGGASAGYSENTATGISIRGFGPEDTAILIDGMPVSNATPGSLTRQVGLDMLSINNASRVELIKVPTPDMPNNSQGGQINLITKSAFEFAKPEYRARIFFNQNSLRTAIITKTPGPGNKKTFKTTPGAEISVSLPLRKNFGITFTGYAAQEFNPTYRGETTETFSGSSSITNGSGVLSLANPAMTRFKVTDIADYVTKTSANVKFDWKPTASQTVGLNFQYSTFNSIEGQRRLDFRPTVAAGADWGPTYFKGTTANSTTDMTVTTLDKIGDTKSAQLQYKFQHGGWNIYVGGSISQSTGHLRDQANGHFSEIALKLNPGQVVFENIRNGIPQTITTYNRTSNGGGIRDYTQLVNYSLDGTIAKSGDADSRNTIGLGKVDVERALDFLPFLGTNSLTIKAGVRRDSEKTEKSGIGSGYRDILDPTKSGMYTVSNFLDTEYAGVSPGFGYPAQQWGSTYKLYQFNQANQIFVKPGDNTTDARENWYSYVGQQKSMTEATNAAYAQMSGSFFKNRLTFIGGARQEQKTRNGRGPFQDGKWYFAKNPDGTEYRDSVTGSLVDLRSTAFLSNPGLLARMTAAGVYYPDHAIPSSGSTPTTLEGAQRARIANRYVNQKQTSDPSPSLSTAFALTKKIDLKASWSRTFGLPSLEDSQYGLLSGNGAFTINENDTPAADGTLGTINVANPGLKPSVSDNWDYQVAYYTATGGKFGVSYFNKTVKNQPAKISIYPGSNPALFNAVMDALGLDPVSYQTWLLTTSTTSDTTQKTHGVELEVRQDFSPLGGWGKYFQVFASYSKNSLGQPAAPVPVTITSPNGTPITITPSVKTITLRSNRFMSGGIQFANRTFSAQVRATYKNDNEIKRSQLSATNFLRTFEPAATRVDVNLNYQLNKTYSLFLSGRDVLNAERKQVIRDDERQLPDYAQFLDLKRFGVTWTFGVSGKW